jgi:predicted MFS family arabinose efflux permease
VPTPSSAPAPRFAHLYLPFAAGYLLSYTFRMANAVISPDLTRELALTPGALGFLTGAYFVAFAAMQLPVGMLLDRYGPRRVEPALLALAGVGALAFATAQSASGLVAGRALIGAGCAAGLMAPLKAIATWYPPERQASLGGWMMVAGGSGALLATAPLAAALTVVSWRIVFYALAAATFAVAVAIWLRVPDMPAHPHPQAAGFAAQWRGVKGVFAHPRFWWIVPLAAFGIGSFMAIQGLWSVPWLMEVEGGSRAVAADHLLAMGGAMLAGYLAIGMFATRLAHRGIAARHLFAAGFAVSGLALAAIVFRVPGSYLWWPAYGLGVVVNVLGFTVLSDGLPRELTGRANTAMNLLMFATSFAAQWGIGVVVDAARGALELDVAGGLRLAFALVLCLYVVAYAWFLRGWRRHARPSDAITASA